MKLLQQWAARSCCPVCVQYFTEGKFRFCQEGSDHPTDPMCCLFPMTGARYSGHSTVPGSRGSSHGIPAASLSPNIHHATGWTQPTWTDPGGHQLPGATNVQVREEEFRPCYRDVSRLNGGNYTKPNRWEVVGANTTFAVKMFFAFFFIAATNVRQIRRVGMIA